MLLVFVPGGVAGVARCALALVQGDAPRAAAGGAGHRRTTTHESKRGDDALMPGGGS